MRPRRSGAVLLRVGVLDDGRHRIHYISTREGLTPFVVGLLKGLAMHFDTDIAQHVGINQRK